MLPKIAVVLVAGLLRCAFDARAQGTDDEIQGFVVDVFGRPLPGVTLTIVNTETGASRLAATDLVFPLQFGQPEGRLTQVGVRVLF